MKLRYLFLMFLLIIFTPFVVKAKMHISCSYDVGEYIYTFDVIEGNKNLKKSKVRKDGSTAKTSFITSLITYNDFKVGDKIECLDTLYLRISEDKKTISFNNKKSGSYTNPVSLVNSVDYSDTDWGPIKDTSLKKICASENIRKPLKMVGLVVGFLKILVPLIIIVLGGVDLFKALTSSKQDAISGAVKSICVRIVAGVCIFFLPGVIQMVLDLVNEWSNYKNTWCCCTECILNADCDVKSCKSKNCKIGGMD